MRNNLARHSDTAQILDSPFLADGRTGMSADGATHVLTADAKYGQIPSKRRALRFGRLLNSHHSAARERPSSIIVKEGRGDPP